MSQNNLDQTGQKIIINQLNNSSNGIGVAGFIFSILGIFLGWIPIFGWFIWILGISFSIAGTFKSPRGLAFSGLIVSILGLVFLIIFILGS
jgi:hypothetical protein